MKKGISLVKGISMLLFMLTCVGGLKAQTSNGISAQEYIKKENISTFYDIIPKMDKKFCDSMTVDYRNYSVHLQVIETPDGRRGVYNVNENKITIPCGKYDNAGFIEYPFDYSHHRTMDPRILWFKDANGKYGFANTYTGKEIAPTFSKIGIAYSINGYYNYPVLAISVFNEKGQMGLASATCNWFVPCEYDTITVANNYSYLYKGKRSFGVLDNKTGKIIIPAGKYQALSDFEYTTDYSFLDSNGKWGIINNNGKVILPAVCSEKVSYISLGEDEDGTRKYAYTVANSSGQVGLVSQNGSWIVPFTNRYDSFDVINSGDLIIACKGNKFGYLTRSGRVLIPCLYTKVWKIGNTRTAYGYLDSNGSIVVHVYAGTKLLTKRVFNNRQLFNAFLRQYVY